MEITRDEAEVLLDKALDQGGYRGESNTWGLRIDGDQIDSWGRVPTPVIRAIVERYLRYDDADRRREGEDALIEEANRIHRRRYYTGVNDAAQEILREAADEFASFDEAAEWIEQRVGEQADSAATYTHENLRTIIDSDEWLAIDDAMDEGVVGSDQFTDLTSVITLAGYFAYLADLRRGIGLYQDEVQWRGAETNPRRSDAAIKRRLMR